MYVCLLSAFQPWVGISYDLWEVARNRLGSLPSSTLPTMKHHSEFTFAMFFCYSRLVRIMESSTAEKHEVHLLLPSIHKNWISWLREQMWPFSIFRFPRAINHVRLLKDLVLFTNSQVNSAVRTSVALTTASFLAT